jgi:hypothetical protein
MNGRKRFNRKRRVTDTPPPQEARKKLASRVTYVGHSHHKREPGDFKLSPPAQPRPDKTHGYPLFEPDPFRQVVLQHWKQS